VKRRKRRSGTNNKRRKRRSGTNNPAGKTVVKDVFGNLFTTWQKNNTIKQKNDGSNRFFAAARTDVSYG
jgi:hypothetical protein